MSTSTSTSLSTAIAKISQALLIVLPIIASSSAEVVEESHYSHSQIHEATRRDDRHFYADSSGSIDTRQDGDEAITANNPWSSLDIGSVETPGSASYLSEGSWTVKGSGSDNTSAPGSTDSIAKDQFHFLYLGMSGDVTAEMRIDGFEAAGENTVWQEGGFMIRETLDADSIHNSLLMTNNGGAEAGENNMNVNDVDVHHLSLSNQWRGMTGGDAEKSSSTNDGTGLSLPIWIKMNKSGNQIYTSYKKHDSADADWIEFAESPQRINFSSDNFYLGLAVMSHDSSELATLRASNLHISQDLKVKTSPTTDLALEFDRALQTKKCNYPSQKKCLKDSRCKWGNNNCYIKGDDPNNNLNNILDDDDICMIQDSKKKCMKNSNCRWDGNNCYRHSGSDTKSRKSRGSKSSKCSGFFSKSAKKSKSKSSKSKYNVTCIDLNFKKCKKAKICMWDDGQCRRDAADDDFYDDFVDGTDDDPSCNNCNNGDDDYYDDFVSPCEDDYAGDDDHYPNRDDDHWGLSKSGKGSAKSGKGSRNSTESYFKFNRDGMQCTSITKKKSCMKLEYCLWSNADNALCIDRPNYLSSNQRLGGIGGTTVKQIQPDSGGARANVFAAFVGVFIVMLHQWN